MLLDEAVIGMFGGGSPFLDVVLRFCRGGPRQAVSVFFGGVMVPSFKGISRGGVKKKAVGAVLDPPPYYYGMQSTCLRDNPNEEVEGQPVQVRSGQQVTVIGICLDWVKIETVDGIEGWLRDACLHRLPSSEDFMRL